MRRKRARGEREAQTYSGKVELGCNGGWLERLPHEAAGGSEEGTGRRGCEGGGGRSPRRMKGRRGGWRRERGWFSSEVTYLEANLIHSPKWREPESGRTSAFVPIGQSRPVLRARDPGIHETRERCLGARDRREAQFWSSLPSGYDPSCGECKVAKFYRPKVKLISAPVKLRGIIPFFLRCISRTLFCTVEYYADLRRRDAFNRNRKFSHLFPFPKSFAPNDVQQFRR